MPEMACSRVVPSCEMTLLSGGHGGTVMPNEADYFFDRVGGKLELVAIADGDP